jgi:hypothetical protein
LQSSEDGRQEQLDLDRHVKSVNLVLYTSYLPRRRLVVIETILLGCLVFELKKALGDGALPTVCLPVVDDLFLLVSGLVETIEDLLASPLLVPS